MTATAATPEAVAGLIFSAGLATAGTPTVDLTDRAACADVAADLLRAAGELIAAAALITGRAHDPARLALRAIDAADDALLQF